MNEAQGCSKHARIGEATMFGRTIIRLPPFRNSKFHKLHHEMHTSDRYISHSQRIYLMSLCLIPFSAIRPLGSLSLQSLGPLAFQSKNKGHDIIVLMHDISSDVDRDLYKSGAVFARAH